MKFNLYTRIKSLVSAADTTLIWDNAASAVKQILTVLLGAPVANISALKAIDVTNISDGVVVTVASFSTAGDGGGGTFRYSASSVAATNPGTVISPTVGAGRWLRVFGDQLNVKWFGAKGDNVTNDTAAIQAAINVANAPVFVPAGDFITDATLLIQGSVGLIGAGGGKTNIRYSGSGSAIQLSATIGSVVSDLTVITTATAANGIEAGNACRNSVIRNVSLSGNSGAGNTGVGLFLNAGAGFSTQLMLDTIYVTGYRFGIKFVGTNLNNDTWTAVTGVNCQFVGRNAGIIAGSAGIYYDALTNGIGTNFIGGAIESYALGIQHLAGGFGGSWFGDMEGNTAEWSVGTTFNGRIVTAQNGDTLEKWTNGSTNVWSIKQQKQGIGPIDESYYPQEYVIYDNTLGNEVSWYRGASKINGGSPGKVAGFGVGGANDDPNARFLRLGLQRVAWGATYPSTGTWAVGDIVFNTSVLTTSGADSWIDHWICTTAGAPGTAVWSTVRITTDKSATINPGTINAGVLYETNVITSFGYTKGVSYAMCSPGVDTTGCLVTCRFIDTDVLRVSIYNATGAPITLGSSTWNFRAQK